MNLDVIKIHADAIARAGQAMLAHATNAKPEEVSPDVVRAHAAAIVGPLAEIQKQVAADAPAKDEAVLPAPIRSAMSDLKQITAVKGAAMDSARTAADAAVQGVHDAIKKMNDNLVMSVERQQRGFESALQKVIERVVPTRSHNPWPWLAGIAIVACAGLSFILLHGARL